ncbi:MAG: nucleotidyltransferase domain-containing protein [Pseudomonadota bacterium]
MEKTLAKIVKYAAGIARPEMIILFGSMSRGTYNAFSDVDLFIVLENRSIKNDIIARLKSYSRERSLDIDVLVYTSREIKKEVEKKHSFIPWILQTGKIVYKNEKTACNVLQGMIE